jgi:hypothetical protein
LVGQHSILVGSIDSSETTHLVTAFSTAAYASPGYLLFVRDGTLMAQPFDAERLQLAGDPVPVAQNVRYSGIGLGYFSVSQTGMLSYANELPNSQLTWLDRQGKRIESVGIPAEVCFGQTLSPDERRVALQCTDPSLQTTDIWVLDLSHGLSSRLTFNPVYDQFPVWSPDGKRLIYRSQVVHDLGISHSLLERATSGEGDEIKLADVGPVQLTDWSPDGRFVLYDSDEGDANSDLWMLPLFGSRQPEPFLETPFSELDGRVSPEGHWIAYASDESGRYEVYIQPFPDGGTKRQISTNGGRYPRWRRDGGELFYVDSDGSLVAAPVKTEPTLEVGIPEVLSVRLGGPVYTMYYDVTSDGQRFLIRSLGE